MAPTPITLIENSISTNIFRSGWDTSLHQEHLDAKAVGSHLPLNKRNSTPVGIGVGNPYSSVKVALAQQNHLAPSQGVPGDSANTHRSLDRCHSEPLKPQVQPAVTSSSRYKTELCRPFAETGFCKYGEKCQFAHGGGELRNMPRHPKYKTELCRTFHTTGLCGYGTRCHFIHNAEERRSPSSFGFGGFRGPEDDLSLQSVTPPCSLHGSPTSSGGAFFGDTFSLVGTHSGSLCTTHEEAYSVLSLDTPPVSPVESLAGDIENLSLSPALSDSPSPPLAHSHSHGFNAFMMDSAKYLRLPIFESLKEAQ